jgi:hypothetical protein
MRYWLVGLGLLEISSISSAVLNDAAVIPTSSVGLPQREVVQGRGRQAEAARPPVEVPRPPLNSGDPYSPTRDPNLSPQAASAPPLPPPAAIPVGSDAYSYLQDDLQPPAPGGNPDPDPQSVEWDSEGGGMPPSTPPQPMMQPDGYAQEGGLSPMDGAYQEGQLPQGYPQEAEYPPVQGE